MVPHCLYRIAPVALRRFFAMTNFASSLYIAFPISVLYHAISLLIVLIFTARLFLIKFHGYGLYGYLSYNYHYAIIYLP